MKNRIVDSYGAMEVGFSTEFPTWILAYCPDTNSWFCTNKRSFYYEYPIKFDSENTGIEYFNTHACEFFKLSQEMNPRKIGSIFLENGMEEYKVTP